MFFRVVGGEGVRGLPGAHKSSLLKSYPRTIPQHLPFIVLILITSGLRANPEQDYYDDDDQVRYLDLYTLTHIYNVCICMYYLCVYVCVRARV